MPLLTIFWITVLLSVDFPYDKFTAVATAYHDTFWSWFFITSVLKSRIFGNHTSKSVPRNITYWINISRKFKYSIIATIISGKSKRMISEMSVTMNVYTHLGFDDAKDEMVRLEELNVAKKEVEKVVGEKPISQQMFKAI